MRAEGKHWYNNGIAEGYFFECPEGWKKGRLPVKESTRMKHCQNNGMHHLTEEQKIARVKKLQDFHQNETLEFKRHKSEAISKAKKGKYKGSTPWNKGKKGLQTAWNKGLKKTQEEREHLKQTLQELPLEKKQAKSKKLSQALTGRTPWNKGLKTGPWSEDHKSQTLTKQYLTKAANHSFNISQAEKFCEECLKEIFGEGGVVSQYQDPLRYPFNCDFYIKSLDLFLELNLTWTHGGHPFNPNNPEDIKQLGRWQEKALESNYYQNAIETWTIRDVKKIQTALNNKLHYKTIYTQSELMVYLEELRDGHKE